jgi:hypothetical protein
VSNGTWFLGLGGKIRLAMACLLKETRSGLSDFCSKPVLLLGGSPVFTSLKILQQARRHSLKSLQEKSAALTFVKDLSRKTEGMGPMTS